MNIKLSDLTGVGWLLVLVTCAVYGVLTVLAVMLFGKHLGGTTIAFLLLPIAVFFFAISVIILKRFGLSVLKRGSESDQKYFVPENEPKKGTFLKCDHCGALQPTGTPPVECDWCHKAWAGREVTL